MRLLIAGAGGHGRVVADTAAINGWSEIAFLDDRYPELTKSGAWDVIGKLDDLPQMTARFDACLAAFGDARLRLRILDRACAAGFVDPPALVHPAAVVSRHANLRAGTVVVAGGIVNAFADIGIGCIINTGATVDHDCQLAAGVHICPGAHLGGNVAIGARSWFGIGAIALQGIRIGSDVTVGAGAVCIADVRDGVTVIGAPAREKSA